MPVLTDYLSRRGEAVVLIAVIVFSIGLMALSRHQKDTFVRSLNDAALTPVQALLSGGQGLLDARSENEKLREELVHRAIEIMRMEEQARENDRLREMLGLKETSGFELVAVRVVGGEAGRVSREFKVDGGERDGIEKNQAVVTAEGLVGKVTLVNERSAFVRPLIARQCNVSVKIARTRTDGILEWNREIGLHLTFLPFRAEVLPGDEVLTSGLGGVFPRGIEVGSVSLVDTRPDGSLQVLVEPAVDFSSIDELFVVRGGEASEKGEDLPEGSPAARERPGEDGEGAVALPSRPAESGRS